MKKGEITDKAKTIGDKRLSDGMAYIGDNKIYADATNIYVEGPARVYGKAYIPVKIVKIPKFVSMLKWDWKQQ